MRVIVFLFFFVLSITAESNNPPVRKTIAVLRPDIFKYDIFVNLILLNMDFSVAVNELNSTKLNNLDKNADLMERINPKLVVCIGNNALAHFEHYTATSNHVPPMVACMVPNVAEKLSGVKNVKAITQEVPVILGTMNLQQVSGKPIKKIGILHAPSQQKFINDNEKLAQSEQMQFVTQTIDTTTEKIKKSLPGILKKFIKSGVDALWITENSNLATKDIVKDIWLPYLNEHKTPILVCDKELVSRDTSLGVLAVYNDLGGLAGQIAELIYEAEDNGWHYPESSIEHPISVQTTLHAKNAEKSNITATESTNVDEIVK